MKTFRLEVLTPERQFFDGEVEQIIVEACDGRLSVLAGHAPMVAPLADGTLVLRQSGQERRAFHSMGFLEVRPDRVLVFAQACEWPEEIDVNRAEAAKERAEARIKTRAENLDLKRAEYALHKALIRIDVANYR